MEFVERDHSNDLIHVDIKSGKVLVDNRSLHNTIYYNNTQEPGTREFLEIEKSRREYEANLNRL